MVIVFSFFSLQSFDHFSLNVLCLPHPYSELICSKMLLWLRTAFLAADFGKHLINGLLDMGGGASSPSLALDHLPAPHLPTELIEGLHDVALSCASRALVKSTGKFCGQLFTFLCADLPGVIQICFVPHQDQGDIFGLFNFIQQVLKWQHFLEAASVRDVVNQHEALTPSHVS